MMPLTTFTGLTIAEETTQSNSKIDKSVQNKLLEENKVRVFVKFSNEPGIRTVTNTNSVKESKDKTIDKIGKEKIRHNFEDYFSAELTESEINQLADEPAVSEIKIVETKNILLQDSVNIVNSSNTWPRKLSGFNLTGLGQSVCVIDTGVNYSHPDLGGCYGNNVVSSNCKVWGGWDYCADDAACTTQDNDPIDVNGHGTHVSGIVAANGTINGVAPEARLIVIKAANASGTFSDDDLIAAISWCVGNSTTYNISVISMSLGGSLNTGFCNTDSLASSINNAVARNISVVVATGNSASSSQIAAPSCVENSTRVSSTTKADAISSFSNRNNLTLLMAPGTSINATCISSQSSGTGYCTKEGTSMATPHVSGAIAIINEYLKLTNQTRTTRQIEVLLNNTGKKITDSSTGLNYSRININSALNELSFNYVSLISPNNTLITNLNQTFSCNASSSLNLTNVTFYLYNSTSLENNTLTNTISGLVNSTTFSYNFTHNDNYTWNCLFVNNLSYSRFANSNFSLIYDATKPTINFTSPTETSSAIINRTNILINVTANDTNLANITIRLFNSTSLVNSSNSSTSPLFVNITNLPEGVYFFNASAFDLAGNVNHTETRNVTIDTNYPAIQFVSPTESSGVFRSRNYIEVNVTASDVTLTNITIRLFNLSGQISTNTSITSPFYINYSSLPNGIYFYNATVNDSLGNINNTATRNITLDTVNPQVNITAPVSTIFTVDNYAIDIRLNESGNCNYSVDNGVTNNTLTANSSSTGFTGMRSSVSNGNYKLSAYCSDLAGNRNNTMNVSFNVSVTASPSSSGGGGGGGAGTTAVTTTTAQTYQATETQIEKGYTTELKKDDKLKFETRNVESGNLDLHTVTISSIGSNSVNLIITSDPINLTLVIGESRNLNLSSANYYDLFVKLENIISSKANITIKSIKEEIPKPVNQTAGKLEGETCINCGETEDKKEKKNTYWYYIISAVILGAAVLLLVRRYMAPHHKAKIEHVIHHPVKHRK